MLNFPDAPTTGQVYGYWKWDNEKWVPAAAAGAGIPEPSPDSNVYGRMNNGSIGNWLRAVALAGDTMTGILALFAGSTVPNTTLTGTVSDNSTKVANTKFAMPKTIVLAAGIDLNTVMAPGSYHCASNSVNGPPTASGQCYLLVDVYGAAPTQYLFQFAISLTDGNLFSRVLLAGSWTAWLSIVAAKTTITGGFSVASVALGGLSGVNYTINPLLGNYQYGTNNGAWTLTAPASDCAVDILVTNTTAGAITFSGFTVGASVGDALTTTNGNKFIISVRRINAISTYVIKALQ